MGPVKMIFAAVGIVATVGVGSCAVNLMMAPVHMANMAVNSATGVVSKTLDPNNVIRKYEWFHDVNNTIGARVNQIKSSKSFLADTPKGSDEYNRVRMELGAQQQSCRQMVADYNANATKTNVSIFMGKEAPSNQNPAVCE